MLGDGLRVLVRIGQLDDVGLDAGELLPHRAGEVARIERLQAGLIGHADGDAGVLLGGLDGAVGGAVLRPFGRCGEGERLGLAERRARDRRARVAAWASAQELTEVSSAPDSGSMPTIWPKRVMKVRRVGSPRSKESTSRRQTRLEITPFAIVHCHSPPYWMSGSLRGDRSDPFLVSRPTDVADRSFPPTPTIRRRPSRQSSPPSSRSAGRIRPAALSRPRSRERRD